MAEISGKSLHEIYKEDARKYKESIEKGLKAKKHNATDKLSVKKLQEQLNTAKKALTESEEKYQKQMDRFLNSEMNESARSHCESQLKLLCPAHKAFEALAAIGKGENNEI
ncbi:hypothetical protein [Lactococcus lactis]|uniref:hypothetical protein n=1 Tax=Lactococcus lactis TaxID=1358 RepID=UPI000727306D|nr:hypothetical protein [Lactococcus lactis]KST98526.1 hypothetical protein KF196_1494 [Lactococcus lactis subsp. lactis]